MALDLYEDLMRLAAALEQHGLPYAVAGAMALAVHGVPRATTDIDLLVRPEHLDRVIEVARSLAYRFEALPIRFGDGMEIRRMTRIEGGEAVTLDLLLVDTNLERAWASRQKVPTADGPLWVVSRDALIEMKVWAGRTRDVADVERLKDLDR